MTTKFNCEVVVDGDEYLVRPMSPIINADEAIALKRMQLSNRFRKERDAAAVEKTALLYACRKLLTCTGSLETARAMCELADTVKSVECGGLVAKEEGRVK